MRRALALLALFAVAAPARAALLFDEAIPTGGSSSSDWETPEFNAPAEAAPPEKAPPAPPAAAPDAPAKEKETAAPEVAAPPPFDDRGVEVDPRLRFEAGLGVWMVEQASRLRLTRPGAALGVTFRPLERLRVDTGYRFTFASQGTEALWVANTLHALSARGHYAYPLGGVWLTAGGGPVAYLTTISTGVQDSPGPLTLGLALGLEAAVGAETAVLGRLVRFEAALASRARRVDLLVGMRVGL